MAHSSEKENRIFYHTDLGSADFTCLEGVWEAQSVGFYVSGRLWEAHSVVFHEVLKLLDVQVLTNLSRGVGPLEKEPTLLLRARV